MEEMRIEYPPLREIEKWPRNPKDHDEELIAASIDRFGFNDPIAIDETSKRLVEGHGRVDSLRARKDAGEEPPKRIKVDERGEWLVPVVRGVDFESTKEAEAYIIGHNKSTERGGWKDDVLAEIVTDLGIDYDGFGSIGLEYSDVFERKTTPPKDPGTNFDAPEKPIAQPGDLWILGDHAFGVCDSLKPENLKLLMEYADVESVDMVHTDPPYAIYGSSTGIASDITDDKMVRPFFRSVVEQIAAAGKPFAHIYICCDWRSWASWWEVAKGTGLTPKNMVVWDKGGGLGGMFANCHELMMFSTLRPLRKGMSQKLSGERPAHGSNVWRINRANSSEQDGRGREHNAQKPLELVETAITTSSDEGETILDLFLGSGTAIVAAERTKRKAIGFEMEPKYADLIVRRWESQTGRTAEREANFFNG